jgi:signal transduction histidine kinase
VKKPWQIWTAFGVCVSVILLSMLWLTWRAVALDQAEVDARHEADAARGRSELQERIALALWRMDWTLAPLIAQEVTRPSYTYRPFLTAPASKGEPARREELASPLLTQASPFVLVHFEVAADGTWSSPQVPSEADNGYALAAGVSNEAIHRSAQRLAELQANVTYDQLVSHVPQTLLPSGTWGFGSSGPVPPSVNNANQWFDDRNPSPYQQVAESPESQVSQVAQAPSQAGQQAAWPVTNDAQSQGESPAQQQRAMSPVDRDQQEWVQRNRGMQNLARSQQVQNWNNSLFLPEMEAAQEGASRPIWAGDRLLLARRIVANGEVRIQGCWLDWPAIQNLLRQEVSDLFPVIEFLPVRGAPAGHLLATLPAQLVIPAAPPANVESRSATATVSAIRISLIIAWCCLVLGCVASAVMLRSVMVLSERRAAFVSAVTHELRSPLTTFRMYAEMLAEGMVRDEQQRRTYLETLRVEADRLSHLVDNVLQYARLERGRAGRRPVAIELERLMQQVTERLPQRAKQAGMILQESPPPADSQHQVWTDPAAVEQILFNLVDNACKYAATANDRRVHLHWSLGNRVVQVRVSDHGPGISAAQSRKLFQPFSKTDQEAAQSAPGIGLGLALCQRLAQDVGGRLIHLPENGSGAVFLLELPLAS